MADYNNAVITTAGQAAVAEALANEKVLTFTRVAIGDGEWTDADTRETATALKNELNSYAFTSKSSKNDQLELTASFLNFDPETQQNVIAAKYNVNEIGVFCKVGDEAEVLYYLTTASGPGDLLSVYDGSNPIQIIYDYVTTISSDAKIEVVFTVFATMESIEALQKQIDELKIIDTALSLESERPVENKVVTEALTKLHGMVSGTTTIENTSDTVKTITTENTSVTSTTTVTKESDAVKKIITEISMAGDTTKYIKTTTITKTDTGSTIEYSYTKE